MPSDHPHTPQSPSQSSPSADHPSKSSASPSRNIHNLPTPAHSINGSMSFPNPDAAQDDASNKRKRDSQDQGDRDLKKAHVEDDRHNTISLGDLHLDVGEKYLLCNTPHPIRRPDPTQDLFTLYGLDDIAKSVARQAEDGSKGVKLRKTYKNQLKESGISGAFDSVRRETNDPQSLTAMAYWPEQEWNNANRHGKEIEKGLPALGSHIFKMAKGPIPRKLFDPIVLGEIAATSVPSALQSAKIGQNGVTRNLQATNAGGARTQKNDIHRPKRSMKRKSYGDSSYEGYGEGYVDDEAQDTGYSTGQDDGSSRKRPKKSSQSNGFQGAPSRQGSSYGPGMVGA